MTETNVPREDEQDNIDPLLEDIAKRSEKYRESLTRPYGSRPCVYASDCDPDSCKRRQVLFVVAGDQHAPIPAAAQERLEAGNDQERLGLRRLDALGFDTIRQQESFRIGHRRKPTVDVIRGKIDAFIAWRRAGHARPLPVPCEVKSLMMFLWQRINSAQDFKQWWWTRKYYWQMIAYLVGYAECEVGLFWVTDMAAHWKPIPVRLDYADAERLLAWAESVMDAVDVYRDKEILPPFSEDRLECERCGFFGRACNPPISEHGALVFDDPETEAALDRMAELRDASREYSSLEKRVKDDAKARAIITPGETDEDLPTIAHPVQIVGLWEISVRAGTRREKARAARTIHPINVGTEKYGPDGAKDDGD